MNTAEGTQQRMSELGVGRAREHNLVFRNEEFERLAHELTSLVAAIVRLLLCPCKYSVVPSFCSILLSFSFSSARGGSRGEQAQQKRKMKRKGEEDSTVAENEEKKDEPRHHRKREEENKAGSQRTLQMIAAT